CCWTASQLPTGCPILRQTDTCGRIVPEVPTSILHIQNQTDITKEVVPRRVQFPFAFGRMINLVRTDLPSISIITWVVKTSPVVCWPSANLIVNVVSWKMSPLSLNTWYIFSPAIECDDPVSAHTRPFFPTESYVD
ncbi:hypothetical protein NPIL_272441, partial [Nephila pilipes]